MSISDDEVEAALHERIPGGSEVWHWIAGGGMQIEDIHREVMSAALSAAAKVRAIREGDGAIEALKPFADAAHMIGEDMDDDYAPEWSPFITARAYRNAAKALAAIPATGGEKE